MLSPECVQEFQSVWLPKISNQGLDRLIDLLEKGSPLLIHGSFTRSAPMGCLATHIAWNHPETCHLNNDAGVVWLSQVAGINPSISRVIREWDCNSTSNYQIRIDLLELLKKQRQERYEQKEVCIVETEDLVEKVSC